jgi:hypothetical protein
MAGAANLLDDLSEAWRNAVASGRVASEFEAPADDPDGRWSKGDCVRFGLVWTGAGIDYEARNLRSNEQIQARVDERTIGTSGFVCQFNGYRALKPGGPPQRLGRQPDISPAPADCRFHCQDATRSLSLLRREPLLQTRLCHATWNAYFNAIPFEKEGHFLWVPAVPGGAASSLPHLPQALARELVEDLVLLFERSQGTILFFNSLHAGASVNHAHAQAVVHRRTLPIERALTVEYKGFALLEGYPARGIAFAQDREIGAVVRAVERLQQSDIPFNLMFVGKRIFLVPRAAEHEIVSEFPSGVLATMEIAGKIIAPDRRTYESAELGQIESAFRKTTIDAESLIDAWERS